MKAAEDAGIREEFQAAIAKTKEKVDRHTKFYWVFPHGGVSAAVTREEATKELNARLKEVGFKRRYTMWDAKQQECWGISAFEVDFGIHRVEGEDYLNADAEGLAVAKEFHETNPQRTWTLVRGKDGLERILPGFLTTEGTQGYVFSARPWETGKELYLNL